MAKQLTPAQEKVWARIIRAATDVDVFISQTGNNMIVWNGSGVRHSTLQALDKAGMIKLVAPDAWQFRITQLIPGYNTPAIPATGTETQAAFGVGDYVVIKPDCTVGELSFIREKGRIGRIVDVSGILRAEFHVIRISPKYCELADFAALSSEPEAGSDATVSPRLNNALNVLTGENHQWIGTSPEGELSKCHGLLDDAGVRDGNLMSITDRVKALVQERDKLLRSEDKYHQENERYVQGLGKILSALMVAQPMNDLIDEIHAIVTEALAEPVGE